MATEMTKPMRTHTDKILGTLEDILHTLLASGVATVERDQLTAELDEIRAQRSQIPTATAAGAGRWTKAAATRTKKLRKKHAKALAAAAETREQKRATSRRSRGTTAACTATITDANAATDGDALRLPHTDEHREIIGETTHLLFQRKARLHRSARVTVGALRTAILAELQRVEADLRDLPRMSYRKSTACRDHHQRAEDQWNDQGADVLIRPLCRN